MDPMFYPPWAHEANGLELKHRVAVQGDEWGLWASQLILWRHEDALMRGDASGAAQVRAEARELEAKFRARVSWWTPGTIFWALVNRSVASGDIGAAAEDLVTWVSVSPTEDVETDNSARTNCRQLLDVAKTFFDAPGAGVHPSAPAIRQGCLDLAAAGYQILNRDQQAFVDRLSQMRVS